MKLWRLLTLPGYALSETERFVWLGFGTVSLLAAILISAMTHADTLDWLLRATCAWAGLNALWGFFFAGLVLLAREARALRMPALQREALISFGLCGGVGIVLPALLLGWAGGHWLTVSILLSFGAGLGTAYALLPPYLVVFALFAAYISASVWQWLPQPMQPGFSAWGGPLVVLLWLVLGWRVRGLVRGSHSLQSPYAPALVAFRRKSWGWESGSNAKRWGLWTPGQEPVWARPSVDLHGCGPGHAEHNLRVALGGWWTPQTRVSRLWQCRVQLVGILVGALILLTLFSTSLHEPMANLAAALGDAGNVVFFGTLISALFATTTVRSLRRRWDKINAELPLLALLPGLGDASAANRALLRASLLPALRVQLALAMLLVALAGVMHLGPAGEAVLLLGLLGSCFLMCVFALMVFSAGPLRGWGSSTAMGAGYVWICVSAAIVELNARPAVTLGDAAVLVLAMGWSVFFVALLWLGRRGWYALQRRPHPFLVS